MLLNTENEIDFNIAGALRGPDIDSSSYPAVVYLKEFTTQVIRYFVGVDYLVLSRDPQQAKRLWEGQSADVQKAVVELWDAQYHFRGHVMSATVSLRAKFSDSPEKLEELTNYKQWLLEALRDGTKDS